MAKEPRTMETLLFSYESDNRGCLVTSSTRRSVTGDTTSYPSPMGYCSERKSRWSEPKQRFMQQSNNSIYVGWRGQHPQHLQHTLPQQSNTLVVPATYQKMKGAAPLCQQGVFVGHNTRTASMGKQPNCEKTFSAHPSYTDHKSSIKTSDRPKPSSFLLSLPHDLSSNSYSSTLAPINLCTHKLSSQLCDIIQLSQQSQQHPYTRMGQQR